MRVSINERDLKLIEHQLNNIYDPAMQVAEAMDLVGQKFAIAMSNADEYIRGLELVFRTELSAEQLEQLKAGDWSVLEGLELDSSQIQALEKYADSLLNESKNIQSAKDEYFKAITSAMDGWNEKYDDTISDISQFSQALTNYKDIIDLVGRKNLGVSTKQMNELA
jgi:hypothetical protein